MIGPSGPAPIWMPYWRRESLMPKLVATAIAIVVMLAGPGSRTA